MGVASVLITKALQTKVCLQLSGSSVPVQAEARLTPYAVIHVYAAEQNTNVKAAESTEVPAKRIKIQRAPLPAIAETILTAAHYLQQFCVASQGHPAVMRPTEAPMNLCRCVETSMA